jgi:hypothetical protein
MKKHLPVFGSSRCKRSPSTDLTKSCIVPRNNNNAISCGLVEALIIYTAFLCKGTNTIHSPWLCRMQIHGLDPLRPLRELPLIQRNRQPPSAKRPQSAFSAPRQIAKQKTKRIRERCVATFTLISNRSGCRNTPTTRPPPPQAAKKKQSRQYTTPETARSTRITTNPAADLAAVTTRAAHSPTRAISRSRRRRSEAGAGDEDEEEEREREREARARTMVAPATATAGAATRGGRRAEAQPWEAAALLGFA